MCMNYPVNGARCDPGPWNTVSCVLFPFLRPKIHFYTVRLFSVKCSCGAEKCYIRTR